MLAPPSARLLLSSERLRRGGGAAPLQGVEVDLAEAVAVVDVALVMEVVVVVVVVVVVEEGSMDRPQDNTGQDEGAAVNWNSNEGSNQIHTLS